MQRTHFKVLTWASAITLLSACRCVAFFVAFSNDLAVLDHQQACYPIEGDVVIEAVVLAFLAPAPTTAPARHKCWGNWSALP